MLLRNTEYYHELLDVGPDRQSRRLVLTDQQKDIPTNGCFYDHGARTFGLGVCQDAIYLLLEDQLVLYIPELKTQIQETGISREFTVTRDDATLFRVTYSYRKALNHLAMEEDEDVDIFLWIHNVLSSAERRAIFVKQNNRLGNLQSVER